MSNFVPAAPAVDSLCRIRHIEVIENCCTKITGLILLSMLSTVQPWDLSPTH